MDQPHVPGVPGVELEHVLRAGQIPQEFPQLSVLQLSLDEQGVSGMHEATTYSQRLPSEKNNVWASVS